MSSDARNGVPEDAGAAPGERADARAAEAEALYREGDALHDAGEFAAALERLQRAIVAQPAHWLARYTLAVLYQDLGRHADAEPIYEALLAEEPGHAKRVKAWHNLGVACQHVGRLERAEAAYRQALAIDPQHRLAAKHLADLLADQGDADAAAAVLAPFLDPAAPGVLDLCDALLLPAIPDSDAAIDAAHARARDRLAALLLRPPQIADPLREIGRLPLFQIGHGVDDLPLLALQAAVFRAACPRLAFVAPHVRGYAGPGPGVATGSGSAGRRLRVGFVSTFFGEHSVGRAMVGLIERLPKERFEVFVNFLSGRGDDSIAQRIAAAAEHAVDVPYDVERAQQAIAAQRLDVLVFADIGLEMLSYCLALGRLAPVQATSWGQPETSGIDTVDDYVSVASWEGRDSPEARYSERLVYFTDVATPSWLPRPEFPTGLPGLTGEGARIYCPHGALKLHPDFDDILVDILAAVPGARLFMHQPGVAGWAARLTARLDRAFAARSGGEALRKRLVWLPPMDRAGYLACLRSADVLLDTPFFGGGPVLIEAIAAATPFVTFGGDALRARIGAGLLEFIGLPGYIADSSIDYVNKVAHLARDRQAQMIYRSALHDHGGRIFADDRVVERWADYLETRAAEAVRAPGRLPGFGF